MNIDSCLGISSYVENGIKVYGFETIYENSIVIISFNPFSGEFLDGSYEMNCLELLPKLLGKQVSVDKEFLYKSDILESFREVRKLHGDDSICVYIDSLVNGYYKGNINVIHIPNIRTYAILNKKEYGGWTAMDYCPFCGAKFPERLDEKLSEILRNEYGLECWKDYKKAPHEFWTNEWWKKRGL